MKSPRALLLYEEENNCELFRTLVRAEGCEMEESPLPSHLRAGPAAFYAFVLFSVDRVTPRLLDIVHVWHDETPGTPLLVTGHRTTQANRIALLEAGVDAYLIDPVDVPELRARIRAALRRLRTHGARLRRFSLGAGTIDLEARVIRAAGRDTRLTPTECEILDHLASHMNQTVPSGDLVKTLWGDDPQKGVHSLRLFIRKLRNKLEPDPAHPFYLVTEPAIGYRLQVPAPEAPNKSLDG